MRSCQIEIRNADAQNDGDTIGDQPTLLLGADSETPMSLMNSWLRVDWYNAGEGYSGDYNPNDQDDLNLLRFDVYVKRGGKWEPVDDASYCTNMPASTPQALLERALWFLFME